MTETYKMAPPAPPPPDGAGTRDDNQNSAAPMTNGPSSGQDTPGNQLWERAWTVDEIRKGAGNWSLAGDAGLLLLLQEFSQRMISRTHEIEKEVDGLVHQAKTSGVRLDNVFNDFIMLANTQFVENACGDRYGASLTEVNVHTPSETIKRVYDEDVSQERTAETEKKSDDQEKSREQREAELIPKVSEALNYGIKVIDEAYETLDVNAMNSDSEDEEIPYRADPILEPKDPYVTRPLPHIIGTPQFMQEDDVGLIEPPSDEESESHGSISESEPEDEKDQSEESSEGEYSESESESSSGGERPAKPVKQRVIHSTSSEESGSEGDLFGEEDSDAERDVNSEPDESRLPQKPAGAVDFTSELASKLGVAPKLPPAEESDEEEKEVSEQISEPKVKVKKERAESSAGKKKKHDHKHRERTKSKLKAKEKMSPEEDTDPFGPPAGADDEDTSPFGGAGLFSGSKGLFDDDEDAAGLFDEIEKPKAKSPEKKAVVTESAEEEPPKEDKRPRTKSGRKVPAGGVSIFGGGDDELFTNSTQEPEPTEPAAAPKPRPGLGGGLFDDEDDDLFSSAPVKSAPKSDKPKAAPARAVDSLFGEEEDDDLFGDRSSSKPAGGAATTTTTAEPEEKAPEKPKKKLPPGAVSMFGNAPNPLAAALKKKLGVDNSDEEDEDQKAGSDGEKSRSGSIKSSHSNLSSNSSLNKHVEVVKKGDNPSHSGSSSSLFADEPEDDLFSVKPPPVTNSSSKSSKKKPSLFGEDEGADLFGEVKGPETKTAPKPVEKKPAAKDSLFGAEDDSPEDDLFGAITAKPRADSVRKKPAGGVALFGGADLFGRKDKPAEVEDKKDDVKDKSVAENKSDVSKSPGRKNTLSLFDEEEEDDLFGGGAKPAVKGGAKIDTPPKGKEPKPTEATRTRTKSKSVFQDEDVLFGGAPDESPSVDLFGDTPPVTPQKTAKPKVSAPSKPPGGGESGGVKLQGATTTSSSSDLFGTDDNEEDLFGEKPKPESKPEIKHGKVSLDDATTTETSDEPEEKKVEPPKPRKPAGAVSMFGGVDPFTELKKKQQKNAPKDPLFDEGDEEGSLFGKPSDKKKTEPPMKSEVEPKPVATKPKKPAGAVSMFGGAGPLGGLKPRAGSKAEDKTEDTAGVDSFGSPGGQSSKTEESVSASPPSPGKGIGKLKANLMINPAALLPGAAPPVKEEEPVAVGFDQPAEAVTLHSETKDRAKILSRRRPQSRKARKQAAASSDLTEEVVNSSDSSPSSQSAGSPPVGTKGSKSAPSSDLFGNDDILEGSTKVTSKSDPILALGMDKGFTDSTEDDIFNKEFPRTPSKGLPSAITEEDDLFSVTVKTKTKTISTESTTTKVESVSSKSNRAEDDLFAGIQTKSSAGLSSPPTDPVLGSENSNTPPSDKPIKGDNPVEKRKTVSLPADDDIFADSSIVKKKDPKPAAESDDIFSDSILNKPATKSEEKFDDDDIFAAATVKKEKKKKLATKDEDLFKDDTDIFADLPATKPKEKKKKKSTTSKKSVFKDDVDDIFADSGLPTKTKKDSEKKKKSTSKKKEAVENIFDDPLNAAGP